MPQVGDYVQQQTLSLQGYNQVECEILYLPSDLPLAVRITLDLISFGECQRRLLEGAACDTIQQIRILVKLHSAFRQQKKKNAHGQKMNTRATRRLQKATDAKLLAIEDYNSLRQAMINLGLGKDDPMFPPLTIEDTVRKPTHIKRAVGDSRETDGLLWTTTGVSAGVRRTCDPTGPSSVQVSAVGTQGSKGIKRKFFTSASQKHILNCSTGKRVYTRGDHRKGKRRATEGGEAAQTKRVLKGILSILYCCLSFMTMQSRWLDMADDNQKSFKCRD